MSHDDATREPDAIDTTRDPGDIDIDIDLDIVVDIDVSAPPCEVWNVIWDLDRYGEWNPECVEAQWTNGASGPAVGACFLGRNRLNGRTWTVRCHIIECTPPTQVCWTVGDPTFASSTWTYTITPTANGCLVSERFVHGPGNSGIKNMIRDDPENASRIVAVREQMLKNNIATGLQAIAVLAETGRG